MSNEQYDDASFGGAAPSNYSGDYDDCKATEGRNPGKGRGLIGKGPRYDFGDRDGRRGRGGGERNGFQNRDRDDGRPAYNRKNNDNWNSNNKDGDSWGEHSDGDRRPRSYNNANDNNNGGNWGGDRSDSDRRPKPSNNDNDTDMNDENKPKPVTYVPQDRSEEELMADFGISKGINFDAYESIRVNVTGDCVPEKIERFDDAHLRGLLMQQLQRCKYDKPTPVQKHAIPIIMTGHDLMATAQTGSGKTAAYLLPIVNTLLEKNEECTNGSACLPGSIILCPTHELAIQIHEVARKFSVGSFLKVHIVYGGVSVRHQINQLQRGCHILIATVGRLKDFLNRGIIAFDNIKYVVLDEADRMLDMGFLTEIETFLEHKSMPKEKQILMFSATFSESVQRVASKYLNRHIFLAVGIVGGACQDVEQNFMEVPGKEKKSTLKSILEKEQSVEGTLLFVEKKRTADFIATYLCENHFRTTSIHGDRHQEQREEALRDFKTRKMHILVATNVAARGLDISGVTHVINYDLPRDIDEYVHRIGRTGRLGNKGKATSFFDPDEKQDQQLAGDLVRILSEANQNVPTFLASKAESGRYQSDHFGGYDYRQSDFKTDSNNQPQCIQEVEAWDT